MNIIEIKNENIAYFADILGEDLTDDMDRTCFKGFGAVDDSGKAQGAIVFELLGQDLECDTESRIRFFEGDSDETKDRLKDVYTMDVRENAIVKSHYETPDDILASYLEGIGFSKDQRESKELVLSLSDVENIPMNRRAKIPPYIRSLSNITVLQYRNFVKKSIIKSNKGLVEDLAYLPRSWFETDISSCSVTDDKIDGVFLIRKTPSGELHAVLYAAYGPDYVKNLGLMLVNTLNSALLKYPPDTKVVINRHSTKVESLTGKLLHGFRGSEEFFGDRTE